MTAKPDSPPSRGSHNPSIAAGLTTWRSMNAEQRRGAVLQAIRDVTEDLGMPPLRRELADWCGMDIKTIRRYLQELEEAGLVVDPGGPGTRTLKCVEMAEEDAQPEEKPKRRRRTSRK
jgi:DNA-binding transcriptional regulator YhcF (GntR family)